MTPPDVLIVDDNTDDRMMIRRHLSRSNETPYSIRECSSGGQALKAIDESPPDILIIDQHLGDMRGTEVLTELRQAGFSDTAVVFLTGSQPVIDPLELGADDFLDKDTITGVQLRRAIENAASKARFRHQLESSKAALGAALEEVQQRLAFEQRLLGVVSHELRSPLQIVMLGVEALRGMADFPPAVTRTLERVERSGYTMSKMISQLLDITRIRGTGRYPISLRRCDIGKALADTVEELRFLYPGRTINWSMDGDAQGMFDEIAVGQLIANLIRNAVEHGDADRPIEVRATPGADAEVIASVTNHGPTIPAEQLPQLFDPFMRVKGENHQAGLGLGLYISRAIATAHGGTLDVASADERTTFTVTLPIRAEVDQTELAE